MKHHAHFLLGLCVLAGTPVLHAQRIMPIGTGLVGIGVYDMVAYDGQLVIGGFFNSFNGHARTNLQGWDGTNHYDHPGAFSTLANRVFALEVFNGDLIAAGNEPGLGHVARWDGAAWHSMGGGLSAQAYALCIFNGELYAAGNDSTVSRWDGTDWQPVGDQFNGRVWTMAVHDGALYAGGAFTHDAADNVELRGLVRWNGTAWEEVANGLNGEVGALLSTPEGLVVRGDFTSNGDGTLGLPYWTVHNGTDFSEPAFTPGPPDPGLNNPMRISAHPDGGFVLNGTPSSLWVKDGQAYEVPFRVRAMLPYGGDLIVAGSGNTLPVGSGGGIGRWLPGVAQAWLDIGGIRANVDAILNTFFQDRVNNRAGFEAPKGQGTHSLYSAAPWVVGEHQGALHGSVPFYGQGTDVNPPAGPNADVMDSDDFMERYLQVWKLDQATIAHHAAHWNDPGYAMPHAIASWPGNGDVANGEPARIAPFADLNGNGIYEPATGEYPLIRGEQAIFQVLHSVPNPPGFTSVPGMALDLAVMHYAYGDSTNADLHNTVFTNLRIINRGTQDFTGTRFGLFADFDIGCPDNDFAGCDSLQSLFYAYNWGDLDPDCSGVQGYGGNIPAQGAMFLSHPMTAHRAWSHGAPGGILRLQSLADAINGTMNNGEPFMELGYPTHFQFPGGAWAESDPTPFIPDRASVGSTGPLPFNVGDTICVDVAFPFARAASGDRLESVEELIVRAQQLHTWYATQDWSCGEVPDIHTGMPVRPAYDRLLLFPNPATDAISMELDPATYSRTLTVHDATGRVVHQDVIAAGSTRHAVQVTGLAPGLYSLRIAGNDDMRSATFIKASE